MDGMKRDGRLLAGMGAWVVGLVLVVVVVANSSGVTAMTVTEVHALGLLALVALVVLAVGGVVLLIAHRSRRDEPIVNDSVDGQHPPDSWHPPFVVR